jgi:RNA ligase (TIGR02306 family)
MSRKLASIQRVLEVNPIAGADAIEVLTILGWKVVAKKGEFKVGDLCCYCEVDSILPERSEFEFLRKNHFRIKTIKLKGQVSQGIAFPLSLVQQALINKDNGEHNTYLINEGDDVTEILGIQKWEVQIPAQLAGAVKGNFPEFLHKTDEERIQTCKQLLEKHQGKKFYVTEKVDGSSMTVYFRRNEHLVDGEFGVCSRNMDLKETEGNSYWKIARELDLEGKLKSLNKNICLQGELIGMGVQGNKYKLPGLEFRVFNIFDIDSGKNVDFLDPLWNWVQEVGLKTVPLITKDFLLPKTVDELVEYSKGKSVLNKDTHREGIVLRPLVEEYSEDLRSRLSFKCINPDFLLKYNE